jgi:molybdenum cofactor cytidylyltransferase
MVSAVVLAAGESKRMREKKEILPIGGEPMIRIVVEKLLRSVKIDEVIIVLGYRANDVGQVLCGISDARVELIANLNYTEGMGTSLAHGIRACSWGSNAFIVVLADTPFFRTEDVDALIDAQAKGASAAVPVFAGRRGHPIVLDASLRDELEELSGDTGARHILEREAASVIEVEIDDDGFLVDVDEWDDYAAVKQGLVSS